MGKFAKLGRQLMRESVRLAWYWIHFFDKLVWQKFNRTFFALRTIAIYKSLGALISYAPSPVQQAKNPSYSIGFWFAKILMFSVVSRLQPVNNI